jgi:hypothetical protein
MTRAQALIIATAQLRPHERISSVVHSTLWGAPGWYASIYSVYTGLTRRIELGG